ncbi:MAG: enoyl-CoA hydratase/isomerase family protein [Candidatus Hydrogenedentota bacterium]
MSYEYLIVEQAGRTTWITLNRPKANALSRDLLVELREAVAAADTDPAVRVILITGGEGRFFAAGADIPTIRDSLDDPMAEGRLLAEGVKTMDRIEGCTTPVVAVVNGVALGGGCELCLACHLRIAADSAMFGQPEINLGIIPGWGGTYRLPWIVGDGRARDWLMTGRQVTAQEALEAGLVSAVVSPDMLHNTAKELAETLASKPPLAMRETIHVLRERLRRPAEAQSIEGTAFERAARSNDAAEGVSAFLEKRAPKFTGE